MLKPILVPLYPDGARAIGVGKTKVFELAASGVLRTVKVGRKRMVAVAELESFPERLAAA